MKLPLGMQTFLMVGQCPIQSHMSSGAKCKDTHVVVVPSVMLHVGSMQPDHADAYHTAFIQTAHSAINNVGNRYAKERK